MATTILSLGCGHETSSQKELMIFCGGGLRPPIAEIAKIFGDENGLNILTDYAGAEALLSKAKLSKRGDIYIPGDKGYVDLAATNGLIISQKSVCYFIPTIFVQKGNPKGINGLKDLTRSGIKIGLGNPKYIPIGRKSKQLLQKNGITWDNIEENLKFQSATVNELCLQIQAKSLDAVIVWDAVAHSYSKYGDEIQIPMAQNIISCIDIGVLKFTNNREIANKFVNFARSQRGQAIFSKHNYQVNPPK